MPSRMQLYVTHRGDNDAEHTVPLSAERPLGSRLKTNPAPHFAALSSTPAPPHGAHLAALGVSALPGFEARLLYAQPLPRVFE